MNANRLLSDAEAEAFIADSDFLWHQIFHLSQNVMTPGANDIEWLLDRVGLPANLEGSSLIDIGTTNGGGAFIAERRGAGPVVAVDIYGPDRFGFDRLKAVIGSKVEFTQETVYQLPEVLGDEKFDEVLFLGVLYHLRHPLLALDSLRRLTGRTLYLETAVCGDPSDPPMARFYRRDELAGDSSNWWAPDVTCLVDWVESSGFVVDRVACWPEDQPTRACLAAHPTPEPPEYLNLSYEVPLIVIPEPGSRGRF
jgi:tRNA (mo5U34)-methyltransferase